jgi:DHA1 family tetracycline resistance protein-like MFS transporter
MGLIGMAFGLGFIMGPALGSFSADLFGLSGPGWVAGAICGLNFFFTAFFLVESRKPTGETRVHRVRLAQWAHTFQNGTVAFLIVTYFFATFAFASFEMTIGFILRDNFGYGPKQIGYYITYCGVLSALLQGGGIGPLVKRFGERTLLSLALIIAAVGLLMLPFVTTQAGLLIALAIFAAGSGIHRPPLFGLISLLTPADEQGATMGVSQSASSLARIVAPFFAATIYEFNKALPYLVCAVMSVVSGVVAYIYLKRPETKGH